MATKGALSSLPKLTPAYGLEEGEKDDAVERATQRVMQAYSARQNLGYDPVMMGFSQGILSSKGNFAEGLGAGLKGMQEAQQRTRDLDVEEAQAGLTMAQAQREQQNAQRAASAFAQVTGAPSAKPTGPLSTEAGQQGSAPAGMRPITVEMAKNFMDRFPKDTDRIKFLMDAAKIYQGRFLMSDQGVFDTMANDGRGAFVDLPARNQKPEDYSTVGGTFRMTPAKHDNYQLAVSAGLAREWITAFKAGESTASIEELAATRKMPTAAKVAPSAVAPAAPTKVGEESGKAPSGAVIGAPITSEKSVKSLAPVNTGGEQGEPAAKPAVSPAAAAEPSALAPRAAPAAAAPAATSAATSAAPALASNRFAFTPSEPSFVSSGATLSGSTAPSGMMSKEALALQTSERDLAKAIAEKNVQGAIDARARYDQAKLDFEKDLALKENASRIKTEEEARKAIQDEDLARKAEIRTKADAGKTAKNFARQFRAISEDPSADKILGAFSDNSVFSAIANLAESGVGLKGYSIGIPELTPILKNLNLDPKEMRTAQVMGMLIAQMQLSKGKMLSGSVSNYDLALMGQSGVTDKDTRLTVRAKADMIERQAQYHADLEEMLDDWKGAMSAFNRSKKVTELSDKFNNDLIDIINGKLKYSNPVKAADAKPAPAKAAASGDKKQENKKISSEDALKKLLGGDK